MNEFKSKRFKKFINAVNKSGGIYKYRWADYDLLNLYLYIFHKKPLHDFKFSENSILANILIQKKYLI